MEKIHELAKYCLNCKTKPCSHACPLNNDIPTFIKYVKENNLIEAYNTLSKTTIMPSICGRICPHTKQCQGSCVRAINGKSVEIGKIEAYIGDYALENNITFTVNKAINKNIAIIGGGPAGLTAAVFLKQNGCNVTIFEENPYLGGILVHGIPDFRLDKNIVKQVINNILDMGIKFTQEKYSAQNFDATMLCFGANESIKLNIPGEELIGVFGANNLLKENAHPNYNSKSVIVIGGGNVAIDAARTVKRLGAKKVTIIYRRTKGDMPAETKEIINAENEDIDFIFQAKPIKIIGNEKVTGIECVKTKSIKDEKSLQEKVIDIPNSNFVIKTDFVISAIGSESNKSIVSQFKLETDEKGYVKIDKNNMTSQKGIFASGDLCGTKTTVAWACRSGRDAAEAILGYLSEG